MIAQDVLRVNANVCILSLIHVLVTVQMDELIGVVTEYVYTTLILMRTTAQSQWLAAAGLLGMIYLTPRKDE